jgi:uncharacterized sulfatase
MVLFESLPKPSLLPFLMACGLFTCSPVMAIASAPGGDRPPNIVWIWADNLAYQDLGCFGSPTNRTPAIDGLARDGVRLTQYCVAHVVCSPSRAGLLTGRQPWRSGIVDVLRPDSPIGLPAEEVTLAEALGDLGYATMAIGKWHLGDRPEFLPTNHGFDGYFGMPYSMDMAPTILIRDTEIAEELPGDAVADLTGRYTDEAIRFLEVNRDRPFFLYLSHTLPHPPLNIPGRFRGDGRPVYNDAIEYLDSETGRLLEAIDRLGLAESTLIVFTSDNGPMAVGGDAGPLRGRIRDSFEGGLRVPFVARFPGRIPPGRVVNEAVIAFDVFPTLVNLAGGAPPDDRPMDGQDIWPLLDGSGRVDRAEPFVWVYDDEVTAVRSGRWKLHLGNRDDRFPQPVLYDIEADPGEANDLAVDHPEVVAGLREFAEAYDQQLPVVWTLRYNVRDPAKAGGGVRRD